VFEVRLVGLDRAYLKRSQWARLLYIKILVMKIIEMTLRALVTVLLLAQLARAHTCMELLDPISPISSGATFANPQELVLAEIEIAASVDVKFQFCYHTEGNYPWAGQMVTT